MAFRSSLLLSLLFGVSCCLSSTKGQYTTVLPLDFRMLGFIQSSVYGKLGTGEEPTMCLNLTFEAPIEVLIGGCNSNFSLGIYQSDIIQINRTTVEKAYQKSSEGEGFCWPTDLEIIFQNLENKMNTGYYEAFQCWRQRTQYPSTGERTVVLNSDEYLPTETTWMDRFREIRFRLMSNEGAHRMIDMKQAIHAAIVEPSKTLCFEYRGEGNIKFTFAKCLFTRNISMILYSDTVYGLNTKEKHLLKLMNYEKCEDEQYMQYNENDEWRIDIEQTRKESQAGVLNVFACTHDVHTDEEDLASKTFPVLTPDTDLMPMEKTFYFALNSESSGIYSADLKRLIDAATYYRKSDVSIRVDLETTAPVSLTLTRSKYEKEGIDKVVIAEYEKTGAIYISYTQLLELLKLTLKPKASLFESDESLYLSVKTYSNRASGSITFLLDTGSNNKFAPAATFIPFNIPNNSTIVRMFDMDRMIDEAMMTNRMVGFELNTTKKVAIFMSKCRFSTRQVLAVNGRPGLFTMSRHAIAEVARLFNDRCDNMESVSPRTAYIHIQTFGEPASGDIKFVRMKYIDERQYLVHYDTFEHLSNEHTAKHINQKIILSHPAGTNLHPNEVDIRYFVETVRSLAYMNFVVEVDNAANISFEFSKCMSGNEDSLRFNVEGKRILTRTEVERLNILMKKPKCNNLSKYGLFIRSEGHFVGKITIHLENFRDLIKGNGGHYTLKRNNVHSVTIPMPLGHTEHPLSIHLTNTQSLPVHLSVSLCAPYAAPVSIWDQPMTVANIKLAEKQLKEMTELAVLAGCNTNLTTVFFSMRSDHAEVKMKVDKAVHDLCDMYPCKSWGTVQYFKNTTNWIIAQCKL